MRDHKIFAIQVSQVPRGLEISFDHQGDNKEWKRRSFVLPWREMLAKSEVRE